MKSIVETKDDSQHLMINVDADIFSREKQPGSDHPTDELKVDAHFKEMVRLADKMKEKLKHFNINSNANIYMADEISGTKPATEETDGHNYEEIEYNTLPKNLFKSEISKRTLTNIKSRVETEETGDRVNEAIKQNGKLSKHYLIHKDNERPFQCAECEKSYKFMKNMKEHLIISHSKGNAFQCHQCPKQFGYKHKLEDLSLIHI